MGNLNFSYGGTLKLCAFEIDVIIRNLESTIKKFDPEYGANQERTVLKADMEENNNINLQSENASSAFSAKKGISSFGEENFNNNSNTKSNTENKETKEENIDLIILSTALDSLFINSKNSNRRSSKTSSKKRIETHLGSTNVSHFRN